MSFPLLQRIPALQLDIPLVRQFFLWHLCTLLYGNSVSQEHRVVCPPFLFGEYHQEEILLFLGPRQEPDMMPEAKAVPKDLETRRSWRVAHPIQPAPVKFRHSSLWGLHSTVAQGFVCPALLWGGSQLRRADVHLKQQAMDRHPLNRRPQHVGWDALHSPTPSTEREHSLKGCKQSVLVMSRQLIDYWKYNWILCLGEI